MKRIAWNKGLTKETDSRIAAYGLSVSKSTKNPATHCNTIGCKNKRGGNNLKCRPCRKGIKAYGLTTVDREKILNNQNGKCLICDRNITFTGIKPLTKHDAVVDHCHKTNKVRGILCCTCNRLLGLIETSDIKLEKIKPYLEIAAVAQLEGNFGPNEDDVGSSPISGTI